MELKLFEMILSSPPHIVDMTTEKRNVRGVAECQKLRKLNFHPLCFVFPLLWTSTIFSVASSLAEFVLAFKQYARETQTIYSYVVPRRPFPI